MYLFRHHMFEGLRKKYHYPVGRARPPPSGVPCVKFPLIDPLTREPVELGRDFHIPAMQGKFLHPEARVARVELLDLVCNKLVLPNSIPSYHFLASLDWTFGQKLTNGREAFWATDTQYPYFGGSGRCKRRDIVSLDETENTDVYLPDESIVVKETRLCCEIICFVTIRGLKRAYKNKRWQVPAEVLTNIEPNTDTLTMFLGRYFEPHHMARERDDLHRPICPGPLALNHCLWTYAYSRHPRRILMERRLPTAFFKTQRFIFGSTPALQDRRWQDEVHAYLCIHFPSQIRKRAYMTREYRDDTLEYSDTWLETIVLG